jgi:hypothetical protein
MQRPAAQATTFAGLRVLMYSIKKKRARSRQQADKDDFANCICCACSSCSSTVVEAKHWKMVLVHFLTDLRRTKDKRNELLRDNHDRSAQYNCSYC